MTEQPFQALLELVRFDQEINQITTQIDACKQDILTLETTLKTAHNSFALVQQKVQDAKKLVDERELILKEVGDAARAKKNILQAAASYKEMMALQAEIQVLQEEEAQSEQKLLDFWNKLDTATKEFNGAQQEYNKHKDEFDQASAQENQEISTLRAQVDALMVQRPPLEVKVPEEWREKYTIMKARVTNPIVPVKNNSCTACFYTVTSQEITRLRRRALLQCQGCFRLLYSEEAMSSDAPLDSK